MKAESFFLINPHIRDNAIKRIMELPFDGKAKITISDAGSKSVRQRGLQFLWYTDVAKAGIGGRHEDTKNGVHRLSKFIWAIPILVRDDEFFADLYKAYSIAFKDKPERMEWFVDTQVHTEAFSTSQMAEFLTDFQRHYGALCNLTDPQDRNLLKYEKVQ